jgi:hypothetical protein
VAAEYRYLIGTDVIQEAEQLSRRCTGSFRRHLLPGKLVFAHEKFSTDSSITTLRSRYEAAPVPGLPTIILPIRMRLGVAA